MRALSAPQLLMLWERGISQTPLQRALALLSAAYPDTSLETLSALSIGERDATLLTLRELTFGPELHGLVTCPACSDRLELNFAVADVRVAETRPGWEEEGNPSEERSHTVDGYTLTFRLPTSRDLAAIAHEDVADLRYLLLARCLLTAEKDGEPMILEQLPEKVLETIETRMAEADPQGDVQLDLVCPACTHRWQVAFDILLFLWAEIHSLAQRILREVHLLASAYGWRETDILAMSPVRRQIYLDMIQAS